MKSLLPLATAAALTLLASNPLLATTYTWTGPASGGTWDTTATNFSAASGTPWDSLNGPSNIANFNTASLTATVSSVTTNGIIFDNTATLSGSNITLAGTTPTITANANGTIGSTLLGTVGLVKAGTAVLTLSAQNTFTGGTLVNAGTLELSFAGGNGNGGTLDSTGTLTINSGATVAGKANNPLGFGFISAKGGININEGGTLTTSNIFSMDRKITSVGGTIASQVSGTVYNFRDVTGATYAFTSSSGGTASVISAVGAGLGGTATFNVTKGGGAIDLNVTGRFQDYPGGTGALVKIGNGVMFLSNTNTHTGGTSVNAGSLIVNDPTSGTGTGAVTVGANGTLGGTGRIGGVIGATSAVTVNGILAPGDPTVGSGIGTLTIGSSSFLRNAVLAAGSTFSIQTGLATSDLLSVFGNFDLTASPTLALSGTLDGVTNYTIATYSGSLSGTFGPVTGLTGSYSVNYGTGTNSAITLQAIPEPGTYAMLLGGFGSLMAFHRMRRRHS